MLAVEHLKRSQLIREWLASIESQFDSPLRYSSPDFIEVERHLRRTQQLHLDVENQADGASSRVSSFNYYSPHLYKIDFETLFLHDSVSMTQ